MSDDQQLIRQFQRGLRKGKDPANTGRDGEAVTTADSIWLADYCDECGHTFRRGDKVLVRYGPPLVVRHHSPSLPCSGEIEGEDESSDEDRGQRFHAALDRSNPPPTGMHAERLLPGNLLLVPVRPRLHCAFCSKTFRPFELTVLCPCSPEEPKCRLGVHRDPGKGNDCYDAWIANGSLSRCPTSFQKVADIPRTTDHP